jgi:hypothetical protein
MHVLNYMLENQGAMKNPLNKHKSHHFQLLIDNYTYLQKSTGPLLGPEVLTLDKPCGASTSFFRFIHDS